MTPLLLYIILFRSFGPHLMTSHPLLSSSPIRSPEILLGLPFSHGIDMWATGCLLVFLYLQHHLFRETSSYGMVSPIFAGRVKKNPSSTWFLSAQCVLCLQMRQIVQLLGQPDDRLLSAGKYTKKYFVHMDASQGSAWRLKVGLSSCRN